MELQPLKKQVSYTHDLSYYNLDDMEFEDGIKMLRKEKAKAIEKLKALGATANLQVVFCLEEGYYDEGLEFEFHCSGTRVETEEEMHKRNAANAKAAEMRSLKKQRADIGEYNMYKKLKAKYET
jgi:hypothetical protein